MRLSFKKIKQLSVETASGIKLGRVSDIVLEIDGQLVAQYVVKHSIISNKTYLISRDQIVRFEDKKIIIDDNVEKIEDQFIHTQFFALVDRNGKLRGQVYDALKQTDLQQLQIDIKKLLAESISGTFVNGVFTNNPQ